MQQLKCLGCDKMVDQTPKKRPKLYCSGKCRQKVWQENRRQEILSLRVKEAASDRNNSLINAARCRDENGVNKDELALAEKEGAEEKKDLSEKKTFPLSDSEIKEKGTRREVKKVFPKCDQSKKAVGQSSQEPFMGHPIPKGLKGIELSIWKAEIKEKDNGKRG